MVLTFSPLEMLFAFALAYLAGMFFSFFMTKYVERARRLAVCDALGT